MKKLLALCLLLAPALLFTGCNNDDDYQPGSAVAKKFTEMYPNATGASWGYVGEYNVVIFNNGGVKNEAWYIMKNATWVQTESAIKFADVPQAVANGLENTKYADWGIVKVIKTQRPNITDTYMIQVEMHNTDANLYFTPDGILIREEFTNQLDNLPAMLPDKIISYVADRLPNAIIVELAIDPSGYNVYMVNDNTIVRMVFNSTTYDWIMTYQLVYEVPKVVLDGFEAVADGKAYTQVDYVTSASSDPYFAFTVGDGANISVIKIDPEGNEIK